MFLLTFKVENEFRLGVKTDAGVVDVKAALTALSPFVSDDPIPTSVDALLHGGVSAQKGLLDFVTQAIENNPSASWLLDESALQLGPCVPNPGKIICIGLNYRRHAAESGAAVPDTPVLFSNLWKESTQEIFSNQRQFGTERYRVIRYEDLVQEPARVIEELCDFLSIEDNPSLRVPTRLGKPWVGNSI